MKKIQAFTRLEKILSSQDRRAKEQLEIKLNPEHFTKSMQALHDAYGNGIGTIKDLGFVFKKKLMH
jgi:hypothetical protein